MKKFYRALALLLCLLLAASSTFAEDIIIAGPVPELIRQAPDESTAGPTAEPTPEPTETPAPAPTPEATVELTVDPTVVLTPMAEPTAEPTDAPAPSAEATAEPTDAPAPSAEATAEPTDAPAPTAEATAEPTDVPVPTTEPTIGPTVEPGAEPEPSPTIEAAPTPTAYPEMQLENDPPVLGIKERYQLEIRFSDGQKHAVSYSTENKRIANVSTRGLITPLSVGETRIIMESEFGQRIALPITVKKAPYGLKLDTNKVSLCEGQTCQLQLTVPEDCAGALKWVSKKPKYATVDENGLITAVRKGETYMRAEAYNGKYASLMVYVYAAPTEISLKTKAVTLGVGQPFTLEVDGELPDESYSFSSDHPEIASVDADGKITALTPGEAVITAESCNGLRDQCRITVKPAPETLAFREKEIIICAKDSYTLRPLLMGGSEGIEVQLESSSGRFKIKGRTIIAASVGTGTLTATAYNGLTATVQLKCIAAPKTLAFTPAETTLYMGTSATPQLNADCSYTLESSDPSIVSVDGQRITAHNPGDVQIRATSYNKKTAVLNVHVPPLPDSLTLAETALILGCGDSCLLTPVIPAGQGSVFHYNSSDSGVASVDASGRVEALAPGSAVISVETLNGLRADCEVRVYEAPTAVSLSPARVVRSMEQGAFALEIRFGGEGQGGRYSIESSDPSVAGISHDGWVTPVAPGETTIAIRTYNGLRASTHITLGEQPSSMSLPEEILIALGDTIPIEPLFDRGCESCTLSVTDTSIAAVSGIRLTGVAAGTTLLRVSSASGLSAECSITVTAPPTGITLSHRDEKLMLGVCPTLQLTGTALPDGAGSILYTSSDPVIASVDANGLVTAHTMGSCIITAVTYDGLHSAECAIEVLGLLHGVKIGIDPGHQRKGNKEGEAVSPTGKGGRKAKVSSGTAGVVTRIPEFKTNLEISLKLRDALEAHGARVYMTRTHHDVNISNQERAKMMNELGVDLVLRIHCNSSTSRSIKGMSIFVRETGTAWEESAHAAQLILDALVAETNAPKLGVKKSDKYTGLNWSTVPSMLLELGYMSNPTEDRLLNTPEYQDKLASGMVSGICTYMNRPTPEEIFQNQEAVS